MPSPQNSASSSNTLASTALHSTISKNHTPNKIRKFATQENINARDAKGRTALFLAIQQNKPSYLEGLFKLGEIDINIPTPEGKTPLHQLISSKEIPNSQIISLVEGLLAKEAKVNTVYDQGNTPLLMALKRKDDIGIQIAQLLLSSGKLSQENIKAVGAQGSAIHYAVSQAKQEDALSLVTSLIEKGANMHALDQDHWNALRWAIKTAGKHSKYKEKYNNAEEIVSTLLDAKLDPNIQDTGGRTTLHETVEHSLEAIVKILLAHNADATIQDENGYTPLHIATRVGRNFQIVKLLSQYKAPLDACSTDGETPLHFAVRIDNKRMRTEHAILFSTTLEFGGSRIRIVRYLLEKGANANPLTRQKKENPLHYLMRYYNESNKKTANKIIELLITYGANPNQKNTDNEMPVDLAPEACREYIQTAIEKAQQSLQSSMTNATDGASRDWSTPSFGG